MTRDPLGPDGWDGELPTPPAAEVRWERVFGLLAEVDDRRGAPLGLPGEPLYTDDGILIVDRSGASSPIATSLGVLVETDLVAPRGRRRRGGSGRMSTWLACGSSSRMHPAISRHLRSARRRVRP